MPSIKFFDVLDSTNSYIKRNAASMQDGDVVAAKRQTGGRGRLGRSFFSPDGGLYFSLILRRNIQNSSLLTPLAAVAVSDALIALGAENVGIKWVNDVYVNLRKVCGILVETAFSPAGELERAIVGVGINITEPDGGFPEEISNRAGAAFKNENAPSPERLLRRFLADFNSRLDKIGDREFLDDYRKRSVLFGKTVEVLPPSGERYFAVCEDIDKDCRLVVNGPRGREALYMGEVSIKL